MQDVILESLKFIAGEWKSEPLFTSKGKSCIGKVRDRTMIHKQILKYLALKMLKLLQNLLTHSLSPSEELKRVYISFDGMVQAFGDQFALIKSTCQSVN